MKRSSGPNSGCARTRFSTTVMNRTSCWNCFRSRQRRVFAVASDSTDQVHGSRRGESIQPDALGFDRQGFSLYPATGAGLLHRRRQVTDVYDALSGRKIIRRDEVTQLMNEERGCPNNSGSPGIFVRSFRFRFGESAEVFAK